MKFTYESYRNLIRLLKQNGYEVCGYGDYKNFEKPVILRHDIDFSVDKAVEFAHLEQEVGVCATYFVLLSTDFYNIHARHTLEALKAIRKAGGIIGLHFDETRYDIAGKEQAIAAIQKEKEILQLSLDMPIEAVSMHRPSQMVLSQNIEIPGMSNAYGEEFFMKFKSVSDSRMHWREDVEQIITSGQYSRLHILTHAFWYYDKEKKTKEILAQFVKNAKNERYISLASNIRDINEFLRKEEV